jgi:uncharacterized protein (TIGR02118 family)
MIKVIGGITRKDGMSVAAFQSYWRDVHAPLIARTPGLRRYIQAHALPETYDEQPPAYDGLAEAWFDSLEAFDAAVATAEWQAAVADAPNFIGKALRMLARELPIIDAFASPAERRGMVKYAGFLKRKEGLTVEAFQKHWREVHGPLVVAEIEGMRRYVQAHALPETYALASPPAWDGVPQAWFDSLEAVPERLRRTRHDPPSTPGAVDSFNTFQQPIPLVLAREVVIVD